MASKQLKQMNELYASIKERLSAPDIDLATLRDIAEKVHLAASEPEAVTYAEVDAGGVPALWCIPEGCDPDRVLLHSHAGGTVVTSMHTDRKALGHIAKVVGACALIVNYRRSPEHKFPAQIDDMEGAYRWLLARGIRPESIASIGHSVGGNFAVSLAVTLREKGVAPPAAVLSVFALVRYGGEERDVGQQRRDRRAYYESSVGDVSRVVDRRHRCGLE
jgi:epsilon-lactone hydrolase